MSYRESMEEDDIVIRVGNSLVLRRTDEGGRVASPKEVPRASRRLALATPESP